MALGGADREERQSERNEVLQRGDERCGGVEHRSGSGGFRPAEDDDPAVCRTGGRELGVEPAGQAALLGDDHADPKTPDGGEIIRDCEGAAAGDDPLRGDPCLPAGGQRLRGVEDADDKRDAGPMGGLRVGGEVPESGSDQDGAAVGEASAATSRWSATNRTDVSVEAGRPALSSVEGAMKPQRSLLTGHSRGDQVLSRQLLLPSSMR